MSFPIGHTAKQKLIAELWLKGAAIHQEERDMARAFLDALKDAERFRYLQNIPVVQAQQYFWNHQSRKQRAEAIDFDMTQNNAVIDRAEKEK